MWASQRSPSHQTWRVKGLGALGLGVAGTGVTPSLPAGAGVVGGVESWPQLAAQPREQPRVQKWPSGLSAPGQDVLPNGPPQPRQQLPLQQFLLLPRGLGASLLTGGGDGHQGTQLAGGSTQRLQS